MANIPHQNRMRRQEELRASIPMEALLHISGMIIMQGRMPILGDDGKPTGEFEKVEMPERLKIMTKLMDKAVPNTPASEEVLGSELPTAIEMTEIVQDPERVKAIDTDTMRELAQLDYTDVKSDKVNPWGSPTQKDENDEA